MNIKPGKSSPFILIESIYKSLTFSEQKVANYVMKNMEESMYYTVTDLAEKSGVGETTVMRFCRKLGYRGYQEFKLAVAQNLDNLVDQDGGEILDGDNLDVIATKITQQNIKSLQDSLALLQVKTLQQSATAITRAERIYFFGIGTSGLTAQDAKHRFMRMGFNVDHASDSHIMAMNASLVGEKDVVVGISSSGSTKDIVDAIRIAKENGCYIICITNHAKSPITQYADSILLAASKESPLQGGAFTSKIGQLHLLNILATTIEMQEKETTFESIRKTAQAVLDKMYLKS